MLVRIPTSTARCLTTLRAFRTAASPPPLSFALDIDGVLLRGPKVLTAAKRALAILEGDNPFQKKIPYILLTNGGGIGEHERCEKLSRQLGFHISPTQYCQAHTILQKFAHTYHDQPVLVLGGKLDTVRNVARGYGYKQAYTTHDVLAWNPAVWPFHTLSDAERASTLPVEFSQTPISAIFVYHDPRNWALDVQIICDVVLSGGIIGGQYVTPDDFRPPVELVFCNPDLLWKSDFENPRLGQGAFKSAFQAVFKSLTGAEYPHVQFGKPTSATYKFAEELLHRRSSELYGGHENHKLSHVYMIGDNPESDIAGANVAQWSSVLVQTGVYDSSSGTPPFTPSHIAEDVEHAVKWAIDQELSKQRA